jgi:hypothetical protein
MTSYADGLRSSRLGSFGALGSGWVRERALRGYPVHCRAGFVAPMIARQPPAGNAEAAGIPCIERCALRHERPVHRAWAPAAE